MGVETGIEWTEHTWNPWQGCTKVSAGCDHCYMFTEKTRYGQTPETVVRSKPPTFNKPLSWKDPAKVFTCSWSDWFHKDADPWRDEAWAIIKATPHLTYQILTKRPGRIARHLPADWGDGYPNVWLGVSVESEDTAHRIPQLLSVPAAVHFLSCEPLLGPLNLVPYFPVDDSESPKVDWVIVGGESGPSARPMAEEWVTTIRNDCAWFGVAFFFKQWGGVGNKRGGDQALLNGERYTQMPSDVNPWGEYVAAKHRAERAASDAFAREILP